MIMEIFTIGKFYFQEDYKYIVTAALLLSIFLVATYLLRRVNRSKILLENHIALLSNYSESIEIMQADIKEYKSEVVWSLERAYNYILDKDEKALVAFCNDQINDNIPVSSNVYNVLARLTLLRMNALKGLILSKYQQADNMGVGFDAAIIHELETLGVIDMDLCRMVGILLDNAIEAASKSRVKEVSLFIKKCGLEEHKWSISIKNTYEGSLHLDKTRWQSTKGKKGGLGLKSYKALINKYPHIEGSTTLSPGMVLQEISFDMDKVRGR